MKVKLTATRAFEHEGRTVVQNVDDVIDVPTDEAKALLEAGSAVPVARKKADRAETR